ncbi:hypothetical protein RHGRI_022573 [Rhododendron griersonianum]|uniref:Ubiquitin-like domain-containing protein n=1 Tax=Rhododendron griersonianum TaxID=479676 RepID=A0AAV6J4M0_9ERIC|nr:hypothetical protein RHGRI_022573 [Rhododendron griersonianum]
MGSGAAEATVSHAVAGGGVTVHICCFNGSKFSVRISLNSTVGSLKSVVAQNCDVAAERQRLIYKGRVLKDDHTLESYGLEADHTVHLVRGFAPATSAVTKVASDPGVPNSTPSGMTSVGSGECGMCGGYSLGASLSSGLGYGLSDNSELFGAGLPILQQVLQKLTQNPNLMREIIDMPSVHNVVDNQNIMQNVIMNDPQIDELIDRNPELAHILTDPSTICQTLEAARNPELMHERMRNTDRVMSNIESPPEGLNMLRRMYENAQEPFLNATTRGGDARNDLGSNPFSTDSQTTSNSAPNANPLPNPWASGGAGGAQMNSNPRLNPAGDVRLPALGGLGHLDYQPVFGSTEDTASLSQFMQNPAVSQMQSVLSNPQYMTQVFLFFVMHNVKMSELHLLRGRNASVVEDATLDFATSSSVSAWSSTINQNVISDAINRPISEFRISSSIAIVFSGLGRESNGWGNRYISLTNPMCMYSYGFDVYFSCTGADHSQ